MESKLKNQIFLDGVLYKYTEDINQVRDNCFKCALREICNEKLDVNSKLCSIFYKDEKSNGFFEKIEREG